MEFLEKDEGDVIGNGVEENKEPKPNSLDNWARTAVPTLIPDQEFLIEKETEEKRKLRAQNFIEEKDVKGEVFRQSLKRITTASSTARYTNLYCSWDDSRPQTVTQTLETPKKSIGLEQPEATISLETKKQLDELRIRKAIEIKEVKEVNRKRKEEKERIEKEEKKRQKLQHDLKNKPYTYNIKGKITFIAKNKKKLPEPPLPKTHWITHEDCPLSFHFENFNLQKDTSTIVDDHRKNYKELRTGEMPESMTITLAPNSKIIKVS